MEFLILAVLLGLIPASIAQSKGHDFFPWWVFGALLWIVALPMALVLKPQAGRGEKQCPACLTRIPAAASICAHCRTAQDMSIAPTPETPTPVRTDWRIIRITGGMVGAFLVLIVIINAVGQ